MLHGESGGARRGQPAIVNDIRVLHQLCYSAVEIAQKLHVDQTTVLHVIEHGTLPKRQQNLYWETVNEASPANNQAAESDMDGGAANDC